MNITKYERDRKAQLVALWLQRPAGKRREHDVLAFYGEMERSHPKLLNRRGGDPYQNLQTDLADNIEGSKR